MKIALLNLDSFVSSAGIKYLIENLEDRVAILCLSERFGGKYGSFLSQLLKNLRRGGFAFVNYQSFNLVYYKIFVNTIYFVKKLLGQRARLIPINVLAKEHQIKIYRTKEPNTSAFVDLLRETNVDLVITFYFDHILRSGITGAPSRGVINAHAAKLPKCKGAFPVFCTSLNNLPGAVTIHKITDETLDTGAIIAQKEFPTITSHGLLNIEHDLMREAAKMIVALVNQMESGESLHETPQTGEGFYMPPPSKGEVKQIMSSGQKLVGFQQYVSAF